MIVFIYIIILLIGIIAILSLSSIEINIQEVVIESHNNIEKIIKLVIKEKDFKSKLQVLEYMQFEIKIRLLLLDKMPIFVLKTNNYKMKEILERQYDKEKQKSRLEKDKIKAKTVSRAILPKIILKQSDFNMEIGTDDAAFTAIASSIVNIIISIALPYVMDVNKMHKVSYQVKPIYLDKNVFFLQFSGIISLKLVHIMKVICQKEEKVKNE